MCHKSVLADAAATTETYHIRPGKSKPGAYTTPPKGKTVPEGNPSPESLEQSGGTVWDLEESRDCPKAVRQNPE